jgi:hypothetical protein
VAFQDSAPVEELQEKDAIPLGEREESLQLPVEKVLTTPAVRKMAMDNNVINYSNECYVHCIDDYSFNTTF